MLSGELSKLWAGLGALAPLRDETNDVRPDLDAHAPLQCATVQSSFLPVAAGLHTHSFTPLEAANWQWLRAKALSRIQEAYEIQGVSRLPQLVAVSRPRPKAAALARHSWTWPGGWFLWLQKVQSECYRAGPLGGRRVNWLKDHVEPRGRLWASFHQPTTLAFPAFGSWLICFFKKF